MEGGLLAKLYAAGCITEKQKQSVEAASKRFEANATLMAIMSRKSVAVFNKFIKFLSETQQGHVAAILLNENTGKCI